MYKPASLQVRMILGLVVLGGFSGLFGGEKKVVTVPGRAPSPNYSAGLKVGDTLYVAGQTGNDPKTNSVPEDFEAEVKQCLENVGAILKAGGADYSDVVAVTVYLTGDFPPARPIHAAHIDAVMGVKSKLPPVRR